MPNLALELEQLRLADRHIADGEARLCRMMENIDVQRAPGRSGPPQAFLDCYRAAEKSLETFYAHRNLIVQVIRDIQQGRLRDTGKCGPYRDG